MIERLVSRMRIRSLLAAALLSAAVLDVAAAPMQEFEPVSVPMQVTQVAAHSYYLLGQAGMVSSANEGFNANAGFVVTSDGVVVFDALGTPALGKRFADLIAKTTNQAVRRVIVSHTTPITFMACRRSRSPASMSGPTSSCATTWRPMPLRPAWPSAGSRCFRG